MTRTICLHGPESTGKSTLAPRLARHLSGAVVDEYGRTFAEANGIDFTMADLVTIARTHDRLTRAMHGIDLLILDTDPLMTAVWADMLFGTRDPWFDAWDAPADLYLLMDVDLPFEQDPIRFYGDDAPRREEDGGPDDVGHHTASTKATRARVRPA